MNLKWMELALLQAQLAFDEDEVPVGSVIIKDDKLIGKGYNKVESLNDCTAHAEIISITSAATSMKDWRLNGSSIYVTKEPCLMCFGAILNARIENVYYGCQDEANGFFLNANSDILKKNHLQVIRGNILNIECKEILIKFFKEKRKKNKNSLNNLLNLD
tara:strand:- start:25 stop:504 length:480 start_codon:yes stop_codon:yes gene_type:complete